MMKAIMYLLKRSAVRAATLIAAGLVLTHVLIGCTPEAPPRVPDEVDSRKVLEAALMQLDQHLKAEGMEKEGVLLLVPTSETWSMESLQSFSPDPRDSCVIPKQMYASVASAATMEEPIAQWVSPSKLWLMPAELPRPDPLIPLDQLNGVPVRTIVTLSRPGFSASGNEALIILRFTWSIHDALARVRLERVGTQWRIQCAQFNYYV
jgi:hypothetical protein